MRSPSHALRSTLHVLWGFCGVLPCQQSISTLSIQRTPLIRKAVLLRFELTSMPRQQVCYGKKRVTAVYDLTALSSPLQPTPRPLQADDYESPTALATGRPGNSPKKLGRLRGVLGEKHANTVALPIIEKRKKPRRREEDEPVDENRDKDEAVQNFEAGIEAATAPVAAENEPQHEFAAAVLHTECTKAGHGEDLDDERVADIGVAIQPESVTGDRYTEEANVVPDEATSERSLLPSSPPQINPHNLHCFELLQLSLHGLVAFDEWSEQLSTHFTVTKIAEASFGEVYRLSLLQDLSTFSSSDESVFKIIALTPPPSELPIDKRKCAAALKQANGMSKPSDVANEVRLLQRMSSIPGFTNFRDVRILQGRPSQPFISAFKAFNSEQKRRKKDTSIFPDPAKKTSYRDEQLWAVIEMQDAGSDLERFVETGQCHSIWSVWDIFWQVVLSLAKGEEGAEFEHRDLHLGNICVRMPTLASALGLQEIDVKRKLNFTGVETTIIDYTISRAIMPDSSIAFHDLAKDSSLFQGDSTEEYQYDIYRFMRSAVYHNEPLVIFDQTSAMSASWEDYHPITNLVWLHFLLHTLLEQLDWPSASRAPPRKQKDAYARWKRSNDLEHELLRVQKLLDPETGLCRNAMRCASDLVGLALTEAWLGEEDVVGESNSEIVVIDLERKEFGDELVERLQSLKVTDMPDERARPCRTRRKQS